MTKKFKIIGDILISLQGRWGTEDYRIGPQDGASLECNEYIVWIIDKNGKKVETINSRNCITFWLIKKQIEEITKDENI